MTSPVKLKTYLLVCITVTVGLFVPGAMAAEDSELNMPAGPDWVNPNVRKDYPGYEIKEERKKNAPSWKQNTNRPGGNIRGGGTTEYLDYKPFYRAHSWKNRKWKKRR